MAGVEGLEPTPLYWQEVIVRTRLKLKRFFKRANRLADVEPVALPSAIHSPESHPTEIRPRQIASFGGGVIRRAVRKLIDHKITSKRSRLQEIGNFLP